MKKERSFYYEEVEAASVNPDMLVASPLDLKLWIRYGTKKLEDFGYYGVLDRLVKSGLLEKIYT